MSYFDCPIWDNEKCPSTDEYAVPRETEIVKGRRVIHVERAAYRNAVFSGTFLLSKTVVLPLPREGKHEVKVECCWFGHRLKETTQPLSLTWLLPKLMKTTMAPCIQI